MQLMSPNIPKFQYYKKITFYRNGRVLSEPFMKLPSRRELPDYYDVIKKPLDIKKIMNRIEDGKVKDMHLNFFNLIITK